MSRPRRFGLALVLMLSGVVTLGGCDFVNTPTKTASGQLYQSGDGRYDPYFTAVHQEQVTTASWPDDSRAARKPVVVALDLRPGASNATILASAQEKKADKGVKQAASETVTAERELALKLTAAAGRLEDLLKRGEDLKKQAVADKQNMGADKADEKKVAKKDEIKREVGAAVDAVDAMLTDAKRGAKEAEELAQKLRATWDGKDEEPAPSEKKDEKKKPEAAAPAKKPASAPAKKPAKAPEEPAAEKPDKPAKPAKAPDEVFNP